MVSSGLNYSYSLFTKLKKIVPANVAFINKYPKEQLGARLFISLQKDSDRNVLKPSRFPAPRFLTDRLQYEPAILF